MCYAHLHLNCLHELIQCLCVTLIKHCTVELLLLHLDMPALLINDVPVCIQCSRLTTMRQNG